MSKINRRSFLAVTSSGIAALTFGDLFAAAKAKDIALGFQTWPIKEMLAKDISGTLKTMSGMGYKLIEMCYPKGYEKIGFGSFVQYKGGELKKMFSDAGLTCPSCHFGTGDLISDDTKLNEAIQWSKDIGLRHMILSTFWLQKDGTLNDYLVAADKLNKAAEKIKAAGMQTAFHNHSFEFVQLDGKLVYDALLERFDPKLVKMQFQTEVINLGYQASDYFKKYPGRFVSAHLSDWTAEKKQVPIGQGVIDWNEFFATAKTGGVETFFVEMNFETYKPSAEYVAKTARI
jgi:sugar phosphate isomerase/epimerase